MATGVSGHFDIAGSSSFTLRVNWSETYDITENKSTVKIDSIQVKSGSWYGFTYYPAGIVKINGVSVLTMDSTQGQYSVLPRATGQWYSIQKGGSTATASLAGIAHNTDGSKTISIEVTGNRFSACDFYTSDGSGGSGWTVKGAKSVALTTIPRASTIGATDANIGATSIIAVSRKSSAYTHTIAYKFGTLSGYLNGNGGTSSTAVKMTETNIPFSVPSSFYGQIPNAKSGVCTLTCTTYSGNTQIGDPKTATFTVTAAEALSRPSVSGTVKDVNAATKALTGNESKLVRYKSTARCTIAAAAKNSAAISKTTLNGSAISGSTDLTNVDASSFVFAAVDSRGYSASQTVKPDIIPYIILTLNASAKRLSPTGDTAALTISGNYFNGNFGAASNTLSVRYRVGYSGDYATITPTVNGNTYTATAQISGLAYTQTYTIEVEVSDALSKVTKSVPVNRGIPVFDWGEHDFNFNVPVRMAVEVTQATLVGDYFDTVDINYVYICGGMMQLSFRGHLKADVPSQTVLLRLPAPVQRFAAFMDLGARYDSTMRSFIYSVNNSADITFGSITGNPWVHINIMMVLA